jgi:energy-converting hydrogenase Eha subunit F
VTPIFVIGVITSLMAIFTRLRYREYYLRSLYTKTLIEDQLELRKPLSGYEFGGHYLAISPTERVDDVRDSLKDPESWIKQHKLRLGTVTFYQILVFFVFIALNAIAIILSIIL